MALAPLALSRRLSSLQAGGAARGEWEEHGGRRDEAGVRAAHCREGDDTRRQQQSQLPQRKLSGEGKEEPSSQASLALLWLKPHRRYLPRHSVR